MGPKTPFYFVGILDVTCALTCTILGCCGVIKNDIEERKKRAEQEAQKVEDVRKKLLNANATAAEEDEAEGPASPDSLVGINYAS